VSRPDLEGLAAFCAVVEAGGVAAAAQRLGLTKSAVSKRVSDLEATLGASLLTRTSRGLVLTEPGQAFYTRARRLLDDLDAAIEEIGGDDGPLTGALRIAAPMSFGRLHLAPALIAFASEHRDLALALDCDDRFVDIAGGGYDLAIRIGQLADSSLIAKKLARSPRVVAASPAYVAAHGAPERPEDLVHHACIWYANSTAVNLWRFAPETPGGDPLVVPVRGRLHVNNGEIIREAAIAGLGIIIQPLFMVSDALARGDLVRLLPDHPPTEDGVYALYPPGRNLSRKVRACLDHLAAAFADPPWLKGT